MSKRTATIAVPRGLVAGLVFVLTVGSPVRSSGPDGDSLLLTPDQKVVLDLISPNSLKGHLSFVASDALQGRDTPSEGLEIAAEYIAAQFRRAGLEPAGNDGYFQTSSWSLLTQNSEDFRFTVTTAGSTLVIPANRIGTNWFEPADLQNLALVKASMDESSPFPLDSLEGRAVIVGSPVASSSASERLSQFRRRQEVISRLARLKPSLVMLVDRSIEGEGSFPAKTLRNPDVGVSGRYPEGLFVITIRDSRLTEAFDAFPVGPTEAGVSLHIAPPLEQKIVLRNVIGLLRGSDPVLKDSYVLLTAHYDHIGGRAGAEGDRIWNGANDNGSGTVSVIEIGSALAQLKQPPRRSIVFVTFFGEERGLLGSRYYGKHPPFPLEKTVAALNLEQVGRVDSTEGDQRERASLTGFDYSDLGRTFEEAGRQTGINVYKHPQYSDVYFSRSDNQAFADLGIPSHTLCVAFNYPDYHGPGDHWDKVDFENMARTNKMIALALLTIAQRDEPPRWSDSNPRASRYLRAWEELHSKQPVPQPLNR